MDEWVKKRRVMRDYDITAHIYDIRYEEEQTAKITAALKHLEIDNRSLVLDVGCGTGLLFNHITEKAGIVGLDISRKTLRHAKKRAASFHNTHLICADADHMPFKRNLFDDVFAFTVLQNTPDPQATLNEVRRVAKPNSSIVVTGLKKCFSRTSFDLLLNSSGLQVLSLDDEYDLKCYVAVTKKSLR